MGLTRDKSLLERYESNPVIRGLIQLLPLGIGSGVDVAITVQLENIRRERLKTFFDELGDGSIQLSEDLLESEDFLHCYFATAKAALNSRRREKIRMFASLLKSSTQEGKLSNIDEYEEYLSILDELSYRELMVLFKIDEYESKFPLKKEDENELQRASRFWEQFSEDLFNELGIPKNEINSILTRLNRTGCYETFVGGYFNYSGGKGKTTSAFHRLKHLIQNEDNTKN